MAVEDPESNDLLDYFRDVILMTAARLNLGLRRKLRLYLTVYLKVAMTSVMSCWNVSQECPLRRYIYLWMCVITNSIIKKMSMRILLCYYIGWLFSQAWYIPKNARNLHQVRSCPWTLK